VEAFSPPVQLLTWTAVDPIHRLER
jgi:hypothetical protein